MNAFSVRINPTKNLIVIEVVARGVYYKRKVRGGRWLVIREARENDWGASRYVRRNKPNGTALSAPAASQRPFNHALTHFSPYLPGTFKKVSPGLDIARSLAERARIHQIPPDPNLKNARYDFSSYFIAFVLFMERRGRDASKIWKNFPEKKYLRKERRIFFKYKCTWALVAVSSFFTNTSGSRNSIVKNYI